MKKFGQTAPLLLASNIAFAHEGIEAGSILHAIAHLDGSYGLIFALPVALAIGFASKRRLNAAKSGTKK